VTRHDDETRVAAAEEASATVGASGIEPSPSSSDGARDAERFSRLSPADFSAIYHVAFPW
jgi:hypothetical protein